jgi:quercetin dioxygenase-like cupin family protein
MIKLSGILYVIMCMSISAQTSSGDKVQNLLASPPYSDTEMGKKMLVDQTYLLMMQVALKPGQMVPQHKANSHVHIMVLEGDVVINLAGKDIPAKKGDLVPIAFKTPMNIKNMSQEKATFVIIKAPNPSQMEE